MVNLEQIKLLESKVAKAIEHLQHLTRENSLLREREAGLKKRIDELDTEVKHYKENQNRVEAGIVSALERLDQFEDTMVSLAGKKVESHPAEARPVETRPAESRQSAQSSPAQSSQSAPVQTTPAPPVRPAEAHPAEARPTELPDAKPSGPVQTQGQAHGKKGSMLRSAGEASETESAAPQNVPDSDQLDIF
ncbi:MAG: cell division protein ZapB [Spirochaetaceae bacterium]|jgi:FtsZ-binding cell division protein ZapB|nr:cell division protein ZapB [Spirochaetaceae bacterium]